MGALGASGALRRAADPRVVGGVLVMVVSAYLGLVLLARGPETMLVAVAARDLPAGLQLQPGDVSLQEVVVESPDRYLGADEAIGTLRAPVVAGELLPRSALTAEQPQLRLVAVPVEGQRLPPDIARGAVVDVWSQEAEPVLEAVGVADVSDPDQWAGSTASVVLAVPRADVPRLLAATRAAEVDITAYQGDS